MKEKKAIFSFLKRTFSIFCAVILAVSGLAFSPQGAIKAKADVEPDFRVYIYSWNDSDEFTIGDYDEHLFYASIYDKYDDPIEPYDYSADFNWKVTGDNKDCFEITRYDEDGNAYVKLTRKAKEKLAEEFYLGATLTLSVTINNKTYEAEYTVALALYNNYDFNVTPAVGNFETPGSTRTFELSVPDNLTGYTWSWSIIEDEYFSIDGSTSDETVNVTVADDVDSYFNDEDNEDAAYVYSELYCNITSPSGNTVSTKKAALYYYKDGLAQNLNVCIDSSANHNFTIGKEESSTFSAFLNMDDMELDENAMVWSFAYGDDRFFEFANGKNTGKEVTVKLKSTAATALGNAITYGGELKVSYTVDGYTSYDNVPLHLTDKYYSITATPIELNFDNNQNRSRSIRLSDPRNLKYSDISLGFGDSNPGDIDPEDIFAVKQNENTITVSVKPNAAGLLQNVDFDEYFYTDLVISYNSLELTYVPLRFYPDIDVENVTYTPDSVTFSSGINKTQEIKAGLDVPAGTKLKYKWYLEESTSAIKAFSLKGNKTDTVTVLYNGSKIPTDENYYLYLEVRSGEHRFTLSKDYVILSFDENGSENGSGNGSGNGSENGSENGFGGESEHSSGGKDNPVNAAPLAVGEKLTPAGVNGIFTVTSSDPSNLTAIYSGIVNTKAKNLTVPASVADTNGFTYKVTAVDLTAYKKAGKLNKLNLPVSISKLIGKLSPKNKLTVVLYINNAKSFSISKKTISGKKITFIIHAPNKKVYDAVVKKLKKAGAKKCSFKFVKSKK